MDRRCFIFRDIGDCEQELQLFKLLCPMIRMKMGNAAPMLTAILNSFS